MKKSILILFLSIIALLPVFSQAPAGTGSIKGAVIDSTTQKPLDYVTVSLKIAGRQAVRTVLTKTDGSFSFEKLPEGKFAVALIYVGYATKTVPADLTGSTKQLNLGTLTLNSQRKQLNAVSITADRPLIRQEVDRISYDLQADPESRVNSVLDMMRKVPLLSLDADDNIQLKGNTNYKILVNGKPSSMMERSPKDILRSMPASTIERIEVITTPPAKYDAEGLAGIINIITTKKVDNGYNGSVNVSERFPVGGPGAGASFTYKQGKFGLSALGGGSLFKTPGTINSSYRNNTANNTILSQNNNRESDSKNGYIGTELSYEIDSLKLLSAQFNINGNRSDGESFQNSLLTGSNGLLQRYELRNTNDGKGSGFDAALNYQLGFKGKKNRLLTFSYRYFGFANSQNSNLAVSNQLTLPGLPNYRQENESSSDEHTFQVDYVHPVKKITIEAGIKGILRGNESDFQYREFQPANGEFITDPDRTNTFKNTQNVFGAYNTYQFNLKNYAFKAGVRVENTVIDADFLSSASQVKQNYFNVVPSVSVNRKFKNSSSLNLGLMQRIQRPGIYQLNPFVDRSNPNFETTGNPNLRPTTGTAIQLGYSKFKKGSLNINIGYNRINRLIFPVSSLNTTTNVTRTRYENTGGAKLANSNINLNYPLTPAWNVTANGNMAYGWVEGTSNGSPIKNEGLMYNFTTSTGYRFKKGWRATANLFINGGNLTIQDRTRGFVGSSFSVNTDIIKDKLSFSAATNNPFTKYRTNHTTTSGPNFDQTTDNRLYFRTTSVSLNYRFGKLKEAIKKNKRGISNDDVSNN